MTHSFDENQRINLLAFQAGSGQITATAPTSRNECPPGHYMMFLVNDAGIPSVARIVAIQGVSVQDALAVSVGAEGERAPTEAELVSVAALLEQPGSYLRAYAREAEIDRAQKGTRVLVGITVTCPYGIGACWGGPYEALGLLDSVAYVRPVPDPNDSTAELFLKGDVLPPLDKWEEQYAQHVNQTSKMRGVEVTLRGTLEQQAGGLILVGRPERRAVALRGLAAHRRSSGATRFANASLWSRAKRVPMTG